MWSQAIIPCSFVRCFSSVVLILACLTKQTFTQQTDFTCQGTNFVQALGNCPDDGAQEATIGGNVRIFVKKARNVPNSDSAGPAAGVSDPFVRFKNGNFHRDTRAKTNTLSPVWDEEVDLGFMNSGEEIKIELWDQDSGLEFSNDLLASTTMRVPFCSMFMANYTTLAQKCDGVLDCKATDSLWQMPRRRMCVEKGEISFNRGLSCSSSSVCLEVEVRIVPYQMEIEQIKGGRFLSAPSVSAAAATNTPYAEQYNFGLPYVGDDTTVINTNAPQFLDVRGGLTVRMQKAEKSFGKAEKIKFYASVNFPSIIYICRFEEDNDDVGVPKWITKGYSDRRLTIEGIVLASSQEYFGCYSTSVPGTRKNKDGGVESGHLTFYTNTVDGLDTNTANEQAIYQHNYIILAVPDTKRRRQDTVEIVYDSNGFMGWVGAYGIIYMWFTYLIYNFLNKIDFRVDRVSNYLASRVLTGKDCSILAGLLVTNGQTPCNVEYRAHMYHMRNAFYLIFCIPFALLLSWGLVCSATVVPEGLGLAVAFLGISGLFLCYGVSLWSRSHWRMSPMTLVSLCLSILFLLIFLFSFIFADPGVVQYGWSLNFAALGLVFATINCVPLLLLAFKQDRSQAKHLHSVMVKMAEAVYYIKDQIVSKARLQKDLKVNKLLHALLGEMYTVNPSLPTFKFSAVLQELTHPKPKPTAADTSKTPVVEEDDEVLERNRQAQKLYGFSLFTLLIYMIIAGVRTNYPSLAFLNCCTLVLLDVVHLSISHGDTKWTPGFMIVLLIMGRLFIMGSPISLWLLNYSAAYMMYAYFLIQEIISSFLPLLSKRLAGEIAFAGVHASDGPPNPDIAGQPYFILGLLTFCFGAMVIITAFGDASDQLPSPHLSVLGYQGWHISAFGLAALCTTVVMGLFMATVRAYYLDHHKLLRGLAKEAYLLRPNIKLPLVLAMSTELAILISGLLLYAATGAAAVLVGAVYLPIIGVLLGYAYFTWLQNDYDLVVWPRQEKQGLGGTGGAGGDPSDLEVAFNMIEDLFGGPQDPQLQVENVEDLDDEEEGNAPVKRATMKGFKLPALKATGSKIDGEVKMPPLPLKRSVLSRVSSRFF